MASAREYLENEMKAAQERAAQIKAELDDLDPSTDSASAAATAPDADSGHLAWLDDLYSFEMKVEDFVENHKSAWVPEAESWLKLHSVQAFIVIGLCAVAVIFLPTLVTLVQFALFVLAACVVGIFLRLAKQKGLAGAEEAVMEWVQDHTAIVTNLFSSFDARIKSLERFIATFKDSGVSVGEKSDSLAGQVKIMPFGRPMTDFKEDPSAKK